MWSDALLMFYVSFSLPVITATLIILVCIYLIFIKLCERNARLREGRGFSAAEGRSTLLQNLAILFISLISKCHVATPQTPACYNTRTLYHMLQISVLRSWRWAKSCPKHVELILEINKLLLLHLVGFYTILPLLMRLNAWMANMNSFSKKKFGFVVSLPLSLHRLPCSFCSNPMFIVR